MCMSKTLLRADALAALVLAELRKRSHCQTATDVNVRSCRDVHPITGAYWAPAGVNPGMSEAEGCRRELWRVCQRLGGRYELAP